jgi:ABC-type multidrug transport system fused ATPase/permease subunit
VLRADGVPYDELDMKSFRRQIGVVLQDPVLLAGTIRDNIAYARPEASDAAVRAAAEAATAARFIEALPDGYSTVVGDEGTGLSGVSVSGLQSPAHCSAHRRYWSSTSRLPISTRPRSRR